MWEPEPVALNEQLPKSSPSRAAPGYHKAMDPWKLMLEADELRIKWQAVLDEYATARQEVRPTAELEKLDAAQEKLKRAYLSKAKAAVDANLAEHKK